jgi:DNA-binding transcriptional LysR family regulator
MIRIDDLALFVRTAALGSFSNAAREVGLLPGQVAAAIKRLEKELDVRLFARSTRSLRLTAEGQQYLPNAQNVLDTLKDGREKLRRESPELQGVLQVAAPSDLGRNVLLPWLSGFRREHPALSIRLFLSDQVADLFRDPVDIAIRYGLLEDANYIAGRLARLPGTSRSAVDAGRPAAPRLPALHAGRAPLRQVANRCAHAERIRPAVLR